MKKGLLVLPGIWSMGRGIGMPSVHKLVDAIDVNFGSIIISWDTYCDTNDYPASEFIRVKKLHSPLRNKYLNYLIARVNYLWLSIVVILVSIRSRNEIGFVYANVGVPAAYVVAKFLHVPLIHRIYGTFLYPYLNNLVQKFKRYEEVMLYLFPADAYVITNDGTRGDLVAKYYDIPLSKVNFWLNGIDTDRSFVVPWRQKLSINNDCVIFSSTCRLTNWKRVDRCINSFMLMNNDRARLLIAGAGDIELQLKELAKEDPRIIFLGKIAEKEARSLVAESDVYVSMHEYSNVGNPLLQALAFGVPTIASNSGCTADFVLHDITGLCVDDSNEDQLIADVLNSMQRLATDEDYRSSLAQGARKFAKSNIKTWDNRIQLELNLIKSLL